ncbi:hypothetical protein B5C34_07390 [Pacificimonas flava]|uniref:SCP domain-containing protein n=2 Tax=Pacificimonas TaxID=1960290 RepID=A0A219B5A8_9SPHN|nr:MULTISPECIES: Ig-like domain-containing protein [Pacificimonas]MBZ6379516.1 tandem-95 repeat protein [Pacificimonas aurantium]OWV33296.1 hypothetical protein B5C34_07390 [Pacificimonas flava]
MGFLPTEFEQLQLELISLFRMDPEGEFDRLIVNGEGVTPEVEAAIQFFGVDLAALESQLDALSAVAPLAWNTALADAADFHSGIMIQTDSQTHQAPGEPGLRERTLDAGYTGQSALGENVFAFTDDPLQGHAGFIIDWGYDASETGSGNFAETGDGIQDPPGHRDSLINATFTEIGISALQESDPSTQVGPWVVTQDLGGALDYEAQFVGVVADDQDLDGFYDMGEGLGGVDITLTNSATSQQFSTTSWDSGGWQIAVPSGTYQITFLGGGLAQSSTETATLGTENVKVDFYQGAVVVLTASDDQAEVSEDGMLILDVLANDEGGTGPYSITATSTPGFGEVVVNDDGTITYTPSANANGTDGFTYTVADSTGASDTAAVEVVVSPVNDAPTASDVAGTGAAGEAITLTPDLADIDGDGVTIVSVGNPDGGTVEIVGEGQSLRFVPDADFAGVATVDFIVSDGNGGEALASAAFTVTAANAPPVLNDDEVVTAEGEVVTVEPLVNDTDPDEDSLVITAVGSPQNGAAVIVSGGLAIQYTPSAGFNGADSFSYTVDDGNGGTSTATISVLVDARNDAPAAADDAASVDEDAAILIDVLANDSDPDGDPLSIDSVLSPNRGGTVSVEGDQIRFEPFANFNGQAEFSYTVVDAGGLTSEASVIVTVDPVNDLPEATPLTVEIEAGEPVTLTPTGEDIDDDPLTVVSIGTAANGAAVLNSDGSVTYTPAAGFTGEDSFSFLISDGNGGTDEGQVTVLVGEEGDPTAFPAIGARLVLGSGEIAGIGEAATEILGTRLGSETVILLGEGQYRFGGSFNQGGDTIVVAGQFMDFTVTREGSTLFLYDSGETLISLALSGTDPVTMIFDDAAYDVSFSTALGEVQFEEVVPIPVSVPAVPEGEPPAIASAGGSQLILSAGESVVTGRGFVQVFGVGQDSETVEVATGSQVRFDPGFNAGGDIIVLPGSQADFTLARSGSTAIIYGEEAAAALPISQDVATLIQFDDVTFELFFDTAEGELVFREEEADMPASMAFASSESADLSPAELETPLTAVVLPETEVLPFIA